MCKISVIVPIYNACEYIERCVISIINQTYKDFNIVLIDDGSTDSSKDILFDYQLRYNNIICINKINGGAGSARNVGIDYAIQILKSEWIAFVDADDWIHPQYLELLFRAASESHKRVSMCGCQDYEIIERIDAFPVYPIDYNLIDTEAMWCKAKSDCVVPWEKLISASLFTDSLRFPAIRYGEDEGLLYKLLFQEREIALLKQKLYCRYKSPDSMMRSSWSLKRIEPLELLKEQAEFFYKKNYINALHISASEYMFWLSDAYDNLFSIKDKLGGTIAERLGKQILNRMFSHALKCFICYKMGIREYKWIYLCPIQKTLKKGGI